MNEVKNICDRIIELLPNSNTIHISIHGDTLLREDCAVFINTDNNVEFEIFATVSYSFITEVTTVIRINETNHPTNVSEELAILSFQLLYSHGGSLPNYGVKIKKTENTYGLDIAELVYKFYDIDDFNEEEEEED